MGQSFDDPSWTIEEDQLFEHALAATPEGDPDRWAKVAAFVPGRDAAEVQQRYGRR